MQPQDALAWQLQQGVAIGVAIFPIMSFFRFLFLLCTHSSTGRNSPKSDSEHSRSPSMRGPSIAWAGGGLRARGSAPRAAALCPGAAAPRTPR